MKKVNIGTTEDPKFAIIGDYYNYLVLGKITYILHEFQDLFSTNFSKMKGISGKLGEMKILFKHEMKLVKQWPYRLNLRYKECVKEELEWMMDVGIIQPMK